MINVSKLDPCLSFAFLINSKKEFLDFKDQLLDFSLYSNSKIFNLFESHEEFMKNLDTQAIRSVHSMSLYSFLDNEK